MRLHIEITDEQAEALLRSALSGLSDPARQMLMRGGATSQRMLIRSAIYLRLGAMIGETPNDGSIPSDD